MPHVLAIDLGTTNFKACLADEAGRTAALARCRSPVAIGPGAGRREIAPDELVAAIAALVSEVRDATPGADIRALSVVGQANSFLLLDEDSEPLTPFVLWSDGRAQPADPRLEIIASQPYFRSETGVPALNGEFMLAKLLWFQRAEPPVWQRARRFCLIADYLVWLLTGQHVTEASFAGLTGLANIHDLSWRRPALAAAKLEQLVLPRIVRAGTVVGPVSAGGAARFGLPSSAIVVAGCLDQYAGAIGAGSIEPKTVCETTGTVLATVALRGGGACQVTHHGASPEVFVGPAFEPRIYWWMCFGNVSANLLDVYRREQPDDPSFEQLDAEAAQAQGVLPQLDLAASAGRRRPIFTPCAAVHARGHFVRAILLAVAQSLRQQVTALGGTDVQRVRSVGGAAQSELWLQLKADTLDLPVEVTTCREPACLGGAILAAAALRAEPVAALAARWALPTKTFLPSAG